MGEGNGEMGREEGKGGGKAMGDRGKTRKEREGSGRKGTGRWTEGNEEINETGGRRKGERKGREGGKNVRQETDGRERELQMGGRRKENG